MTNINDVGEGYLLIDGQSLEHVKIAEIKDIEGNNQCIRIAMSEYLGEA